MLSANEILQLVESLIWLLAGVGVFIVGMNFMSQALEMCAGRGMKRMLENPELREHYARKATIRGRDFSKEKLVNQTEQFFEELLK